MHWYVYITYIYCSSSSYSFSAECSSYSAQFNSFLTDLAASTSGQTERNNTGVLY